MDECDVLDYTCDQICTNGKGSFSCSCVAGYNQFNSTCKAINGMLILQNVFDIIS